MAAHTVLTGVKPTGEPHIGNYLGAIRPALKMARGPDTQSMLFIADYHSLIDVRDREQLRQMTEQVAATWLACGLDPYRTIMYRQSDVPEVFELAWILSCMTPKGLMNRAHAYKARVSENEQAGREDPDYGVSMGLYSYPVLMAADILLFSAHEVPVGEDQIQHVEIARDIAEKFNRAYGEVLQIPEYVVQKESKVVPGLDGQKMSKSYNNYIPLFAPPKKLRKFVMKIKTDSQPPEAPKDPDNSILMDLYGEFATESEIQDLKSRYFQGVAWGDVKEELYRVIDREVAKLREEYQRLMDNPSEIHTFLDQGATKARPMARRLIGEVRRAVGID